MLLTTLLTYALASQQRTCRDLKDLYGANDCCGDGVSPDKVLSTSCTLDRAVHTVRLTSSVGLNGLYSPPKNADESPNLPLVVFLQGGTESFRSKLYGLPDRSGLQNVGDYGLIEINHFDAATNYTYWPFASPITGIAAGFVTRTMDDDVAAIVSFIDQAKQKHSYKSVILIGHSMGTHIAAPVVFPDLKAWDPSMFTTLDFSSPTTVREMHPNLEELSARVDFVSLLTPYDLSSIAFGASIAPLFGDRVGAPAKPFFMYMCAFDRLLPWAGMGANILEFLGGDASTVPFEISGERLYNATLLHADSKTTVTMDLVDAPQYNPELNPMRDIADNEETELTEFQVDNVKGSIMVVGRSNFLHGAPQPCAHGYVDSISGKLTTKIKQRMLGIQ